MEQPPCVLISTDYKVLATLLGVWTLNFAFHLGVWTYLLIHNVSTPFVVLPPRPVGFLRISPVAWAVYLLALIVQLTAVGSYWHFRLPQSKIVEADMFIGGTILLGAVSLFFNPAKVSGLAPVFIWLMWEYVGFAVYLFVFVLQMTPEERERMWYALIYHEFVAHAGAYVGVIIGAAALYRANPAYLGMKALSAWDALYFSIVTITTTGYGDILQRAVCGSSPRGKCLSGYSSLCCS